MSLTNVFVPDWPRKLAIWLGITTLLPMVAYFGAAALFTPPDEEAYSDTTSALNQQIQSGSDAEKATAKTKLDQTEKEHRDSGRKFGRRLFWASYVVGIVAVGIGLFAPIQAVGAGLMFGGIIAIGDGCYMAWDQLGRWPRFSSLLLALVAFLVLSSIRLRPRPVVVVVQPAASP